MQPAIDDSGQVLRPDGFWKRRGDYVTWRTPSVETEIRINVLAIGRLALEPTIPGATQPEGEGVLLGHKHPGAVVVEECVLQGRDVYRPGAERRSRRQNERVPVGWYRMAGGAQFPTDRMAAELCARRLLRGRQVLFFLRTDWVDGTVATAYVVMDGKIAARSPVLTLDNSVDLESGGHEPQHHAPEAPPDSVGVETHAPERETVPLTEHTLQGAHRPGPAALDRAAYDPVASTVRHSRGFGWRTALPWTIGGIAITLAVISTLLQYKTARLLNPGDANTRSTLGLDGIRNGSQLRLTWNVRHPAILSATGGKLTILDGPITKPIDLSPGELQNGSIVYVPATNDLSVRLEVIDGQRGRSLSETVRVLAGPWPDGERLGTWDNPVPGATAALPPLRRGLRETGLGLDQPREIRRVPVAEKSSQAAQSQPESAPQTPESGSTTAMPQTRATTSPFEVTVTGSERPPSNGTLPIVVSRRIQAPPVQAQEVATTQAPPTSTADTAKTMPAAAVANPAAQGGSTAVPTAPGPAASPVSQPPANSSPQGAQTTGPAAGRLAQSSLQPAVLVHRVQPVFPPAARNRGLSATVVVRGLIGTDGRVREVRAIDGPALFRSAAESAVRQWRYRPTLLAGRPVENEIQIKIEFNREN